MTDMCFFFRQGVFVKERSVSVILLSGGQGKRMGVIMYLLFQTCLQFFFCSNSARACSLVLVPLVRVRFTSLTILGDN